MISFKLKMPKFDGGWKIDSAEIRDLYSPIALITFVREQKRISARLDMNKQMFIDRVPEGIKGCVRDIVDEVVEWFMEGEKQ